MNDDVNNQPYLYFFKEILYIAQDCNTLETALYISINWLRNNYNYKKCTKRITEPTYSLYDKDGNTIKTARGDKLKIIEVNDHKFVSLLSF